MKRTNDFVVGLTMLVGIIIIVGATLWVNQTDFRRDENEVVARFRDVGGARVGTPVVVRGVQAGRVEAMELADNGFVEVRLVLDAGVELPGQPVVLLNEASLFGEWQATIIERGAVGRDPDVNRQLEEAAAINDNVLPGATLPDIARLTAVAGRIAGDVASVAERVRVAFDDDAAREMRQSIRNFADLSSVLAQTVREQSRNLNAVGDDVRGGVESLARSAELLRAVAERVDSSTSRGEVARVVADAAEAARLLREAGRRLSVIAEQLGRSQDRLESMLARGDSIANKLNTGEGSLGLLINDPSVYRHTDSLMMELRALIADVRANPRKYVNLRIF